MNKPNVGVLSDPAYIRILQRNKALKSAVCLSGTRSDIGVIFFSYNDIDFDALDVIGYRLVGGRWERIVCKIPQVIYDQAHSCPTSLRKKLMDIPFLRFVNEKIGFWKWETHQALSSFAEVRDYLPETYFFDQNKQVDAMLKKHGRIVLKPVHGLKAMGLILLAAQNGKIKFQYRQTGKDRMNYVFGELDELGDMRKQFPVMKKEEYIVQQGLELAKYKDCVFDVRALVQKDGNNTWNVSLVAKVGPVNSQITALGDWSSMDNVESHLVSNYGKQYDNLNERIKKLAIGTAEAVEMAFVPLGEIALDIAVDTNANIWILEVNSMPSKSMFYDIFSNSDLERVLARPVDYACFLFRIMCGSINKRQITYKKAPQNRTVFLTQKQCRMYALNDDNKSITLTVGSQTHTLEKAVCNDDEDHTICFSDDLRSTLFIPENVMLQVKLKEVDHLELGPLIGVFISPKKIASLVNGKKDHVYYRLSDTAGLYAGICCFFCIGDIDWENMLVKALIRESEKWFSRIMPLPKVFYDRCFGKDARRNSLLLRQYLNVGDYQVINNLAKLGKWETMETLKMHKILHQHLPETKIYRSDSDIVNFLNSYKSIYLKPDRLYKGKGIYRLKYGPGGSYIIEFRNDDQNKTVYLPTLKDLRKMLSRYLEAGWGYLMQEAIELAEYKGYPFDFRLLYQKDWKGHWQPSCIVARLAAPGSIVTSPRSGGAVVEFDTVLKEVFNEDIRGDNGLYQEVVDVGREVVRAIEGEFGECVELGLDMAIDKHGKVWIIEVNGKPLKVSIKRLNDPEVLNRCYDRPIEYAIYRSGFVAHDTKMAGRQLDDTWSVSE